MAHPLRHARVTPNATVSPNSRRTLRVCRGRLQCGSVTRKGRITQLTRLVRAEECEAGAEEPDPRPKANPTADHGITTPEPGNTTADRGNTTADRGNPTADHGNPTAEHGNTTPEHGYITAEHGNTTADRGNTTADHGIPTVQPFFRGQAARKVSTPSTQRGTVARQHRSDPPAE